MGQAWIDGVRVVVAWDDGHRSAFHPLWLRDACRCPACGDPWRGLRSLSLGDLDPGIRPAKAWIDNEGALRVTWSPDDHASTYDAPWLRDHCPSSVERDRRRHRPALWDGTLARTAIELDFATVMGSDAGMFRLLALVRDYGIAFVRGAPSDLDLVERVAGLIGYIPETNYGRIFDYYADPTPSTQANAAHDLTLHTDEAYRHRPPQIALFHAIQQSPDGGGASLFVDGFMAAARLKARSPEDFAFLTRVPVTYHRIQPGPEGTTAPADGLLPPRHTGADLRSQGRAIALDVDGEVAAIRFAGINASPPDLPAALVDGYYRTIGAFARIVRDPTLRITVPLAGGDMAFFDNERVLHGRTAFDPDAGMRHIRSCYVDRESFHSQLRLIGRRLGRTDTDLRIAGGFGP